MKANPFQGFCLKVNPFHQGFCPCYWCMRGTGPETPTVAHAVEVAFIKGQASWSVLRPILAVRLGWLDQWRLDRKVRLLRSVRRRHPNGGPT